MCIQWTRVLYSVVITWQSNPPFSQFNMFSQCLYTIHIYTSSFVFCHFVIFTIVKLSLLLVFCRNIKQHDIWESWRGSPRHKPEEKNVSFTMIVFSVSVFIVDFYAIYKYIYIYRFFKVNVIKLWYVTPIMPPLSIRVTSKACPMDD